VNIELVLALWVNDDCIYLVTFDFFVSQQEGIPTFCLIITCVDVPDIDLAVTVTYKEFSAVVERQGVWVLLFH
jgi:hypothetical protein